MKKISTILILVLVLTLFCCNDSKKMKSNSEQNSTEESEKPKNIELFSYTPKNQNNKPIEEGDSYAKKHVLKESENNFKISEDNIRVVIPNSDEKMKILDVFNVSDYNDNRKYNAIVIHISNGKTRATNHVVTHKLIADIKISKIDGLSSTHLEDGNLKVYIINDDIIDQDEKSAFIECAKKETTYNHDKCELPKEIIAMDDNGDPILRPREQEGDIITGG